MKGSYRQDRELVDRMLQGDERAYGAFIDQNYPSLYRFAFRRVGADHEAAEDVVQETFGKVMTKLGTYRGEATLLTWMCSFCRFEIAAHWRRVGKKNREVWLDEENAGMQNALQRHAESVEGPDADLQRQDVEKSVWAALGQLPIRYCDALEWKYMHGLSVREIADRLDVSAKAAESLLNRARHAFRSGFETKIEG